MLSRSTGLHFNSTWVTFTSCRVSGLFGPEAVQRSARSMSDRLRKGILIIAGEPDLIVTAKSIAAGRLPPL